MSDDSRYRVRRIDRVRIVDVIGREEPPPGPVLPPVAKPPMPPAPPRRTPAGSRPALRPPTHDFELDELAAPTQELVTMTVGGYTVVIERNFDQVALALPGAVRLCGSADEAERLARALLEAASRVRER